MAKPSDTYQWSTTPGSASDPGSVRKASGFLAGKLAPSKWFNWLLNGAGLWHAYVDNLHNEAEFLEQDYSWEGTHVFGEVLQLDGDNVLVYAAPQARVSSVPFEWMINPLGTHPPNIGDSEVVFSAADAAGTIRAPIHIPQGAALVGFTLALSLGSSADVYVELKRRQFNASTGVTSITSVYSHTYAGISGTHLYPQPVGSFMNIGDRYSWFLDVYLGAGASFANCSITGVAFAWNDPGPRASVG